MQEPIKPDLTELTALEASLWRGDSRFDQTLMDAIFAPDFTEFGRSGRRYQRSEMFFEPTDSATIDASLHDFTIRELSADIALCTYVSEMRGADGTDWGNRSSIWDRSSGAWQLRFHQGTPCAAMPPC